MFHTLTEEIQDLISSLRWACINGYNIEPVEDFMRAKISLNEMIEIVEHNVISRMESRPLSAWQMEHYAEYTLNALQTLKEI